MPAARPDFLGAILVGGASRRMGFPKAGLLFEDGRTMLERVRAALLAAGARDVLLVGGTAPGTIPDVMPGAGPLAALAALHGTARVAAAAVPVLVCPCDMPWLDAPLLGRLAAASGPVAAFRVAGEPAARPLPLRVDAHGLAVARELVGQGQRALRALLAAVALREIEIDATEARTIDDVDEPGDALPARPPHLSPR